MGKTASIFSVKSKRRWQSCPMTCHEVSIERLLPKGKHSKALGTQEKALWQKEKRGGQAHRVDQV
ncbi:MULTISPECIES: hypothetical protein [unclassified Roseibium]|jgi:hypothetical protein|uniref:hypothetical protein n=1 Tax=unclassified Roseibium TaxID=2629323 RepID=UPI0010645AC6|nr:MULTISPECIES: hypothetical protein [unclassified Roseibium]